jgi:hypothetical protein
MCTRCGNPHLADPLLLCLSCAIEVRRDFYRGLEELEGYLAAWAAFRDWEEAHAVGAR